MGECNWAQNPGVYPHAFPQLIKFQAMFKEPTKAYIFYEISLSTPDKSVFDLSPGLLQFLPKIFLSFSFPHPIPIIKGTLLPELI